MELIVCLVAVLASALTFFSGFGLGTLLMPAFAVFYPIEVAIASTAVVHFLNGLFKVALVGRHADRTAVIRFGLPAIAAALVGAWLLGRLAHAAPWMSTTVGPVAIDVVPAKAVVGALLIGLTLLELSPWFQRLALPTSWLPLGGVLSGLLGGISGMQGALRTAFLIRLGLSKEAFIGTGAIIAAMVDVSRLSLYAGQLSEARATLNLPLLAAAVACAFAGALIGNRYLKKVTLATVQHIVAVMLVVVGVALIAGWL